MLTSAALAAAAFATAAEQVWRVEEFAGTPAGRLPSIAKLRETLQIYGGAQHLPESERQERDRSKIVQTAPQAALIDAWVSLFAAAPPGKLRRLVPVESDQEGGRPPGEPATNVPPEVTPSTTPRTPPRFSARTTLARAVTHQLHTPSTDGGNESVRGTRQRILRRRALKKVSLPLL